MSSCTHIFIKYNPSNSDYWLEHCVTDIYIYCRRVIIQVLPGGWHLYPSANINGQYCNVLTNNLNLKGVIHRYMGVGWHPTVSSTTVSNFHWPIYCILYWTLRPKGRSFQHLHIMRVPISIYVLMRNPFRDCYS